MTGAIAYTTLETLDLQLGQANDHFTVLNTHDHTTRINAMAGDDEVSIAAIAGPTQLHTHFGDDTVILGNASKQLVDILAPLTIQGGLGADQMIVNASGVNADNTGHLTSDGLAGLGMTGFVEYTTLEDLDIRLGEGRDHFTIHDTHDHTTQINLLSDNDTVRIAHISGDTTINAHHGDDTITISTGLNAATRLDATLTILGDLGTDTLTIDDSGNDQDTTTRLNQHQLQGMGNGDLNYVSIESLGLQLGSGHNHVSVDALPSGHTTLDTGAGDDVLTFDVQNIDAGTLDLNTASGNDQVTIEAMTAIATLNTASGDDHIQVLTLASSTSIDAGDNNDTLTIGHPLQGLESIDAPLVLTGGLGIDTLALNDSVNTTDTTAQLLGHQFISTPLSDPIHYAAMETVWLQLGQGNDRLDVDETHAGFTYIQTANGDDQVTIINDQSEGETVIATGNGEDEVNVEAIAAPTTVKTGSDNDTITIGKNQQHLDRIAAPLTVTGGLGTDALVVDDRTTSQDTTTTLSDTQINGLSMAAPINYGTVESLKVAFGRRQ